MGDKTEQDLRQVFDSVDKDGNGVLDVSEIVQCAQELGMECTEDDLNKVFKQVDKNFDGKISFEEFCAWWKLGGSNKLEGLVFMKLKSLQLLKRANTHLDRLGGLLENKYGDGDERHAHFGVKVGDPQERTCTKGALNFNNEEVQSTFDSMTNGLDNMDAKKITFVMSLETGEDVKAADAQEELQDKVQELMTMVEQIPPVAMFLKDVKFEWGVDGSRVKMGVTCEIPMVQGMVDMYSQQVSAMLGDQVSLKVEGGTVWDTDVKQVLDSTLAKLYPPFMCNVDACLKGQALKNLLGAQLERLKEDTPRYKQDKYMMMSLLFLLKGGKMQMNLNKVDLSEAMAQSPLGGMSQQVVRDLAMGMVPMVQAGLQQAPPLAMDFMEVMAENFSPDVKMMMYVPKLCLTSHMKTAGLGEVWDMVKLD